MLVERTRRVVRFTPLGNKMAAKAHRILREAEELAEMARSAGKPLADDLRMSVIPTIAPFLLPKLLPALRKQYPDLKLYLREEASAAAIEALHHGQVDCVLLALPLRPAMLKRRRFLRTVFMLHFLRTTHAIRPRALRPN